MDYETEQEYTEQIKPSQITITLGDLEDSMAEWINKVNHEASDYLERGLYGESARLFFWAEGGRDFLTHLGRELGTSDLEEDGTFEGGQDG